MHLQNGIENTLERGLLKKVYEKLRVKGHFDFKHPFARARKGAFEKNYEKLRAKGYFDFKTPFRACTKGVFEKKSTKNYARKAFSILKHRFARARKGVFPIGYYRLKCVLPLDAKRLILLSWRK